MNFVLFCGILAIILPVCLSVHPGDPFPTDLLESKTITSEDILNNNNEIKDPNDDEIPLDSSVNEDEDLMDVVNSTTTTTTTTTTKSTMISTKFRYHSNPRKNNLKEKLSLFKTTTTHPPITEYFDNSDRVEKTSPIAQESPILFPVKPIRRKNLIKIGRWKYNDPQTKSIRYWYEPEGGQMGTGWSFDGFLFQAFNRSEPGTEPVYAFHSEIRGVWTNTIQMDPRPPIIGNDQWIPDGVSFYAYRTLGNFTRLQPVLRYWNKLKPGATDATETRITYLITQPMDDNNEDEFEWTFDNILFYALPIENKISKQDNVSFFFK